MADPAEAELLALQETEVESQGTGWATEFSADVSVATMRQCVTNGWLERRSVESFRLTDAGRAMLHGTTGGDDHADA